MGEGREAYRPRWPQATTLHRAVREGWPAVDAQAAEGTRLPRRIRQEVQRYLVGRRVPCLAQFEMQGCHESTLVAFVRADLLDRSALARALGDPPSWCIDQRERRVSRIAYVVEK
jgi:hypothetical protein